MADRARQQEVKIDGSALRAARQRRLWTQEELAAAAALSGTVQRAEAGEPASIETLRALAAALEVPSTRLRLPKPIAKGLLWGAVCGTTGIATGTACATYAILTGGAHGAEAGIAMGLVGALGGAAMALLGVAIAQSMIGPAGPGSATAWRGERVPPREGRDP